MVNYFISYKNPLTHLVDIVISINSLKTELTEFQLPAWRPGRYELQNYAANIKQFKAYDKEGRSLPFIKTSRNKWQVKNNKAKEIKISYQYYAYQMDAGACWLDEEQLYLNFICCLMYPPEKIYEKCTVQFSLPENYRIACGIPARDHVLVAENFYHLADSPMIASASLTHLSFECQNIPFHIWIQGINLVPEEKLISDFKKFTEVQITTMGDFPEKDYHYLFQFLPYRHYHGVEHRNSTVITLGPAEAIAGKGYANLLGISSHELFHAWNIKKIRPIEMCPYDFTKENYFTTGYVAEGFTTYYGDLFLLRSGVFTPEEYFAELNVTFKKHFGHFGNQNLSLAESSQDLWVDGYTAGIPDRKVSIYVKGSIAALILDLEIRKITKSKKSLDDLMRLLWKNFGKKGKGYSHEDIVASVKKIAGVNMKDFFAECILGHTDLKDRLEKALDFVGIKLQEQISEIISEAKFGFKFSTKNNRYFIEAIAPDSPAEKIFSKDDELLTINNAVAEGNLNDQLSVSDPINIVLKRWGRIVTVSLPKKSSENYFPQYQIKYHGEVSEKSTAFFYNN
jgi:predicted metalloprotease with PDZ domain